MKKKNIFWTLWLSFVLFALTACGSSPELPSRPAAYRLNHTELDLEEQPLLYATAGEKGFFLLTGQIFEDGELYRVDQNGQTLQLGPVSGLLEGSYNTLMPWSLQAGPGSGGWLGVEAIDGYAHYFLCRLDENGERTDLLDLNASMAAAGLDNLERTAVDGEGWVYLQNSGKIFVLDQKLDLRFSLDAGSSGSMVLLSDGRAAVPVLLSAVPGEPAVYELRAIGRETEDWDTVYPLPEGAQADVYAYRFYAGSGDYLFFLTDSSALYGWNVETGGYEIILDSNSGISLSSEQVVCAAAGEDGRLFVLSSWRGKAELTALTPADAAQLPEKTVLTLGCLTTDPSLSGLVADFNKSSEEYRVEIREYGEPVEEGLLRLNLDIASGKVPDLLCVDRMPVERLGVMGLLEDLWPYIDSDPEVSREQLMDHVLECAQQDGKLYMVFKGFSIYTTVGAASVVGERFSWTLADLQAALEQMPEGCFPYSPYDCKRYFLMDLINADLERYVDWSAGACFFDSEEFRELLRFVDSLEIDPDVRDSNIYYQESDILAGRQMLYVPLFGFSSFFDMQRYETLFGGPVSLIGYPSDGGRCGSSFDTGGSTNCPIAMTTTCMEPDGAWAFLRTLLLPQGVDKSRHVTNLTFPINREDFEQLVQLSMAEQEEDAVKMGYSFQTPEGDVLRSEFYRPVTQAEYEQVMALYESIDHLYAGDAALWEITSELASRFFAGDGTVEQTAEAIQNRAELYMNERA